MGTDKNIKLHIVTDIKVSVEIIPGNFFKMMIGLACLQHVLAVIAS